MNTDHMDERIIKIETKISFLEDFLLQMQEMFLAQGKEIEKLTSENKRIQDKIQEMMDGEELLNQRPPHY